MSAQPQPAVPQGELDARLRESSFASLPDAFYTRVTGTPLPAPTLIAINPDVADLLGLEDTALQDPGLADLLAGNRPPPNAQPLAAVYSGHQFGVWAGQLGDGRAMLLGAVEHAGQRWELQLKGAGLTPYSRTADGRAVLRSSIREYLCSEAMAGLGIPTTRALALVASDATVWRERAETAAVVTRVAPSFIRFGSFEHWYSRREPERLRQLTDYTLQHFFPELLDDKNPVVALLGEVTRRTAVLMAAWQAVGFCHGVMNTDNMSILGLTLDYGPFGFLDAYDPEHICNHSDDSGRYAYRNQPEIGRWNLYCLGQALMPLIGEVETAETVLKTYPQLYATAWSAAMRAKLGLRASLPQDQSLCDQLLALLAGQHIDFTIFFRTLGSLRLDDASHDAPLRDLFPDRAAFDAWAVLYRERLRQENSDDPTRKRAMNRVNPKYILRNHLAETAIQRAQDKDYSEITRLAGILRAPFDEHPGQESAAGLPPDWASGLAVSCSS